MPLPKAGTYTIEDIYNLPGNQRAELLDGQIYYMALDLSVICDKSKLDERGCKGAPDWIIDQSKDRIFVYDLRKEDYQQRGDSFIRALSLNERIPSVSM